MSEKPGVTLHRTPPANMQAGSPPEAVAMQMRMLEEAEETLFGGRLPVDSEDFSSEEQAPPPSQRVAFSSARPEPDQGKSCSPAEFDILRRLRESSSVLEIRVNGVELSLDVLDVDRSADSVCCLVKASGLRCKIPKSEDVTIMLNGEELQTVFLGVWHTISWLGVHVVVFPIKPQNIAT